MNTSTESFSYDQEIIDPDTSPTAAQAPLSPAHDVQLDETLEFLSFAHTDTGYKGLIQFNIKYPSGESGSRYVKVQPEKVECFQELPDTEAVTCEVSMDRDTFFKVYMNEIHPKRAVLSGAVKVRNWRFYELRDFGLSFDLTTEKWNEYYEFKGIQPSSSSSSSSIPSSSSSSSSSSTTSWADYISFGLEGAEGLIKGVVALIAPSTAVCESKGACASQVYLQEIESFRKKLHSYQVALPTASFALPLFNSIHAKYAPKQMESLLEPLRPDMPVLPTKVIFEHQPSLVPADQPAPSSLLQLSPSISSSSTSTSRRLGLGQKAISIHGFKGLIEEFPEDFSISVHAHTHAHACAPSTSSESLALPNSEASATSLKTFSRTLRNELRDLGTVLDRSLELELHSSSMSRVDSFLYS